MKYQVLYLNRDPLECAKEYTDEHVKIMCLRLAQTFSYLYRKNAKFGELLEQLYFMQALEKNSDRFYRWLMDSNENYLWAFNHFRALIAEYQYRFDKPHPSASIAEVMKDWRPMEMRNGDPPFCAPPFLEDVKHARDNNKKILKEGDRVDAISAINSYRAWYDEEQMCSVRNFTKRPVPSWSLVHTPPSTPPRLGSIERRPLRGVQPARSHPPRLSPEQRRQAELLLGLTTNGR